MIRHVQNGTNADITARRTALARKAAQAILDDARRGPAMGTNVEQRIAGLGRAQLAQIVGLLFDELSIRDSVDQDAQQ